MDAQLRRLEKQSGSMTRSGVDVASYGIFCFNLFESPGFICERCLWWNIAANNFIVMKYCDDVIFHREFSPFVSKGFSDLRYTLRVYFRFTAPTAVTWKIRFWELSKLILTQSWEFRVRSNSIHGSFSEFLRFFLLLKKVRWCFMWLDDRNHQFSCKKNSTGFISVSDTVTIL